MTTRAYIFQQCLGLSSYSAEPSSSEQSTAASAAAGSSQTAEPAEPPLKRFKFLQQQLSSSRTQSASAELFNYAAEMYSGTVPNCSAIKFWQARRLDIHFCPRSPLI